MLFDFRNNIAPKSNLQRTICRFDVFSNNFFKSQFVKQVRRNGAREFQSEGVQVEK